MPPANLNGRALLQSEIERMFSDNSLFRIYGCGNTDSSQGWGIGPTTDFADTFVDDPDGRIGNLNVNNVLYNNYALGQNTPPAPTLHKGMKETWPKDTFTLASFIDDGDVDSA